MNNLIKKFKKSKKDYIDKNYDYSTQKGSVDYSKKKEGEKLFDNLTEEAEKRFATWKKRQIPSWYVEGLNNGNNGRSVA